MAASWVKHVAALDLGTNTFNLVISKADKPFPPVYRAEKAVFLGKGGLKNKIILPDALKRAENVLKTYSGILKKYNITQISAVATEAIRNANNGSEILTHLDSDAPFTIQKIDGSHEAKLIWQGVASAGLLTNETAMIIDIGGASTEIIIADANRVKWLKSYKVGVSRALEIIPVSDLPSEDELCTLKEYFNANMASLTEIITKYQPESLIGTAGSFDSWRKNLESENNNSTPYCRLNKNEIFDLIQKTNNTNKSNRVKIKGIPEMRKETIVPAGVLIQNLLDIYDFKKIYQCSYSLAEGLIGEMTENK